MSDYKGNNVFEKIAAFIPGYKGYSERKGRRDTDKILREEIASKLKEKISVLDGIIRDLTANGKLDSINRYDRLKSRIILLSDQIQFATYGEAGFFDVIQIREDTLDQLYLFDLNIKKQVEQIISDIDQMGEADSFLKDLDKLESSVKNLALQFNRRETLITEVR